MNCLGPRLRRDIPKLFLVTNPPASLLSLQSPATSPPVGKVNAIKENIYFSSLPLSFPSRKNIYKKIS